MPLVNMQEMLLSARRAKKAVGAFNVTNYETALAVFKAAEAEKEPVIVQLYMRLFDTGKARDLAPLLRGLAERATVPVALHLDHGSTEKQAADALAWGYTSVMFDGSRLPFDENAARTKAVADAAHAAGATCEGEIGHVAMGDETALTEPDEAAAFAKTSGVDALAVSIGTAHGYYKAEPKLDIPRCAAIAEALPGVPLVLHGGSGTPLADVRRAIESGIAKVNIATEFLDTYIKSTLKVFGDLDGGFVPPDKLADPIVDACAAHVARLVRFFAGR
ncbi:MAG: class II fructose-bisphosphate aldolase [Kiritimatiellae bacterium]|nr:class II fructose-bisphosphate aldolase [Kiritimatiellia bacterium]